MNSSINPLPHLSSLLPLPPPPPPSLRPSLCAGYDVPRLTSTSNPRLLLPSPRLVSRNVHEPAAIKGHNVPDLSNMVQVWGQFLDHDITGTPAHKGMWKVILCQVQFRLCPFSAGCGLPSPALPPTKVCGRSLCVRFSLGVVHSLQDVAFHRRHSRPQRYVEGRCVSGSV